MSQSGVISVQSGNLPPSVATSYVTNSGTAIPVANVLDVLGNYVVAGATPVGTIGSGNTVTIQVQLSQASASSSALNAGLVSFNNAQFTVDVNGYVSAIGTAFGQTITGQTGGALSPVAGNWNIIGNDTALNGFGSYATGTGNTLTIHSQGPAKWVVNTAAGVGTHTSLAGAMASASSGDTIYLQTSVTENVTLTPGVNIVALVGSEQTPTISITGKLTMTAAGTCTISGIRLTTNSDYFLEITGSAASAVVLENCYLNCLNNTGLHLTSSGGASITALYCSGNIATTGISCFVATSGTITMKYTDIENSGGATTASTGAAMTFFGEYCIFGFVFSFTTTGVGDFYYCYITNGGALNTTAVTTAGTGATHNLFQCILTGGSASAVSIGSGTTCAIQNCSINSSNTNAITGLGTLNYSGLVFPGTSRLINTTSQTDQNVGTFTPVLNFGGLTTGITYTNQNGWYQRNDSLINFTIFLNLSSKGSASGSMTITGLPFTASANNNNDYFTSIQTITTAGVSYYVSNLPASSSTLSTFSVLSTTGAYTAVANTQFANSTVVRIQGSYFI